MTSSGIFISSLGGIFKRYYTDHLKYCMQESESYREIFGKRDQAYQQYLKFEKALAEKKDKLFKLRDPTKWGGFKDQSEMIRLREELLKDREASFDYMLPKESQELDFKRQELCFYTNQCWDEIRRVSKDNG